MEATDAGDDAAELVGDDAAELVPGWLAPQEYGTKLGLSGSEPDAKEKSMGHHREVANSTTVEANYTMVTTS